MINEENSSFYLRYLVKISDRNPIPIDEIPKVFRNYFSIAGLCRSINISVPPPRVNWSEVENYINGTFFKNFDSFIQGINDNFSTDMDKYYAIYFYLTHHLKCDNKKESSSIDDVFKTDKARYSEFNTFFIESIKKVGFNSDTHQISQYDFATRYHWNLLQPPKEPRYNNTCVYITIDNQQYITMPYNGTGYLNNDNEFVFEYHKNLFLVPLYLSLSLYFPNDNFLNALKFPFNFEEYSKLNKADFDEELAFETSPFQVIAVKEGIYEFQFSFNNSSTAFSFQFYIKKGENWESRDRKYVSIECLDKGLPPRYFSVDSDKKRSRYKLTICFPEKGQYFLKVFLNRLYLFELYFNVEKGSDSLLSIPGYALDEARFNAITPINGLSTVNNGFVRIRFTVKKKRAPLSIYLYKIKPGTFDRESDVISGDNYCQSFTLELPFKNSIIEAESGSDDDRLVEDWVLVKFPEDRRWEVCIYFKNDKGTYSYAMYYFDVSGSGGQDVNYSIFDVPKTRTFIEFKTNTPDEVWTKPSSSVVILNELDYYFHVFSEKKLKVYFHQTDDDDPQTVWPTLMTETETGENNIVDREYSATFTKNGSYELNLWGEKFIGRQKYFIVDFELPEESNEEKKLMDKLADKLEGRINYTEDIPQSIQKNVDKLLKDAIKHKEEEKEREKKDQNEKDEKELERRREEERHREEEEQEEMKRQEKEERERKEKERKEKLEIEKLEKAKKKISKNKPSKVKSQKVKSSEGQTEINNLRQMASNLEQQNQKLDERLDEMERKENLLKLDFLKQINQLRNDWEKKDQKLTQERLESSRNRKMQYEDMERREKLLAERKISNLNKRIRMIEKQLETDPNKRNELVQLQQKLIEEENNDIFTLSARQQKRIDEDRKEEMEFEEKSLNEQFKKINAINKLEDEMRREESKIKYTKHQVNQQFEFEEEDAIEDVNSEFEIEEEEEDNEEEDNDEDVSTPNKNDNDKSCSIKVSESQTSEKKDEPSTESKSGNGKSGCCLLI